MSMNPPHNISSDDAAIFSANTDTDDDDTPDTEDPVTRGASKLGQMDNFRPFPTKMHKGTMIAGTGEPQAFGFQMTPGAKRDPTVRGADRKKGSRRRFA